MTKTHNNDDNNNNNKTLIIPILDSILLESIWFLVRCD